jgi:hypothetical protein
LSLSGYVNTGKIERKGEMVWQSVSTEFWIFCSMGVRCRQYRDVDIGQEKR